MSQQQLTVVAEVRRGLDKMSGELAAVLPDHINAGALIRVAQTAIQLSPDLQECTKSSLLGACTKAAEAGLLPDGEQGAIVAYNVKVGRGQNERWEKQAKFLPMVAGLRDLVRRSGVIKEWKVRLVYAGDEFEYVDGDEERLTHKPMFKPGAAIRLVYSIAYDLDGSVQSRNVMRIDEVEAIRRRSRSADKGPWVTDYAEMVKKTCLRRHFKSLPRAKDDLQRERMVGAIRSLDDAENVIDVEPARPAIEAPRLTMNEAARERLREAVETSAFDSDMDAAESVETPPAPPRAPRKRKTADERLAEANAGRAGGNGQPAQAVGEQRTAAPSQNTKAPATSSASPAQPAASPADEGRDLTYEQEDRVHTFNRQPHAEADNPAPAGNDMEDDGDEAGADEPEIVAYRGGWRARMTGKTRMPPRTITTQDEAAAWLQGYDAADTTINIGNAPKNEEHSEALLSRMIDRQFS
jgi:recombination protein RecT